MPLPAEVILRDRLIGRGIADAKGWNAMRSKHVAAAIAPFHPLGSDRTGSPGAAFQSVLERLRRCRLVHG
jgi:hypothetical protein